LGLGYGPTADLQNPLGGVEASGRALLKVCLKTRPARGTGRRRPPCSAGFEACCVADFPVGKACHLAATFGLSRAAHPSHGLQVRKPATRQTWKSALRQGDLARLLYQAADPIGRPGRLFQTGSKVDSPVVVKETGPSRRIEGGLTSRQPRACGHAGAAVSSWLLWFRRAEGTIWKNL